MQDVLTIAIVCLAAAYVIRRVWLTLTGRMTGCGCGNKGCHKTGAPSSTVQDSLHSLNVVE